MKEKIHVTLETETMERLRAIRLKTKVAASVILDQIIVNGIEDIEKLNYNFSEYLRKRL